MRVQFTQIHLVGGLHHHHIASLRAVDSVGGTPYETTREKWVEFIEGNNSGFVRDAAGNQAEVGVRSNNQVKWLQTYADGIWTDNLLALPRY